MDLLNAALLYANLGWPVLPLWWPTTDGTCSCRGGASCANPGKHPLAGLVPHGLKDASTDHGVLEDWWTRYPEANVGLATGWGFDAIDFDIHSDPPGIQAFSDFTKRHGFALGLVAAQLVVVRTGSGGTQWYFRPTGAGNRAKMLPNVDWRGRGGYVVAPPSLHASGGRYEWIAGPDDRPLPDAPEWLAQLARGEDGEERRPRRPARPPVRLAPGTRGTDKAVGALRWACRKLAETPPGAPGREGRNHELYVQARWLFEEFVAHGELEASLAEDWLTDAALASGLGVDEIVKTFASGSQAGLASPKVRS